MPLFVYNPDMSLLNELVLPPLTSDLLKQIGQQDRQNGVNMIEGWRTLREQMGFADGRTPAREAYEDGYYAVVAEPKVPAEQTTTNTPHDLLMLDSAMRGLDT